RNRCYVFDLAGAPVETRDFATPCSIHDVVIERIGGDIAILNHPHGMPVAKRNLAVFAAAGNADRSAFLLAATNLVGEFIRRDNVVELRGRLVVPGTPGLTAVRCD